MCAFLLARTAEDHHVIVFVFIGQVGNIEVQAEVIAERHRDIGDLCFDRFKRIIVLLRVAFRKGSGIAADRQIGTAGEHIPSDLRHAARKNDFFQI